MVQSKRRRTAAMTAFALLAVIAEVAGRSITAHVDRALHVAPLASTNASYYPFLLAAVKTGAALGLAWLLWRMVRARATARAGARLVTTLGHRHAPFAPRVRLRLSPRLWLASFAATSVAYLIQTDVERVTVGQWPLLAPWLHTYALPVFAVLAVFVALGWGAVARWLADADRYAAATFARARRILSGAAPVPVRRARPTDAHGPRTLFGLSFESRPPPLAV
jgi:hypothetical protein